MPGSVNLLDLQPGQATAPVNHPVLTSPFTDLVTPPPTRRDYETTPAPGPVPPMPASFNNAPLQASMAVNYNGPAVGGPFNSAMNPVMAPMHPNMVPVNPAANPYQQNPHMAYPQNPYQQPYQVQ